ncbi:MAG: YggT family protein [Clostridiales bacterium]|nr:YggT family protein [Clostridiales bacterium]
MQQIIYVITGVVNYFIIILQFLMLARALLSWLPLGEDNQIANFLYMVTEPVVMPVRMILERFRWARNMPIDISFFVAMLILILIQAILPPVIV